MHSIRAYLTLCLLATLAACSSLPTQTPIATPANLSLHQQHLASLSRIQQFELKADWACKPMVKATAPACYGSTTQTKTTYAFIPP